MTIWQALEEEIERTRLEIDDKMKALIDETLKIQRQMECQHKNIKSGRCLDCGAMFED